MLLGGTDSEKESFRLMPDRIYKVGRDEDTNDIVIPNDSVSGYHACFHPGKSAAINASWSLYTCCMCTCLYACYKLRLSPSAALVRTYCHVSKHPVVYAAYVLFYYAAT